MAQVVLIMNIIEKYKQRKAAKRLKQEQMSKGKKLFKRVGGTILYILIVFALVYYTPKLLSYALNTEYPMAAITSGSMWPELKKGDLVFIQGIDPRTVEVNDIVVYTNQKNAFTIHRVVELRDDKLVTKGDANNVNDDPVQYEDIVGRLYKIGNWNTRIPKLGLISISVNKP